MPTLPGARPSHPARRGLPASALVVLLALASSALGDRSPAAGQEPPETEAGLPFLSPCRSEMDARLAFGLCPDGSFDFYASGSYRPDVPRPDQILGYPTGSWHTTYGRMERYLEALAGAAPERVRVFDYGRSVERQTMHLIAVSSEANIARLGEIRADLRRLADPRRTTPAGAAEIAGRTPIVVWLNAANDGNETAAFEAAMQVAYQLAAGEDERTRSLRENAVTLINLAHNPESHERFVAWYNAFVAGDANPAALEHRAPWGMSTNNNHYQMDLNRDALGLTQRESRAVAAELQRWRPQVFVDLHGQTTQFFFPPAAPPVNPVYPAHMEKWLEVFGRGNAAAFDAHGWSYYTRDIFDLYYPGYWDTYPALHGATGMTYETDGGGSKGVRWRRDDGTILTFADGIAHHFVACLATVETAARNREARLRDYHDFFASGLAEARQDPLRTVILLPGADPGRTARLATTLLRHGVEVRSVVRPGEVAATEYLSGRPVRTRVPAGAYLVDLAQPNARLARTLLAPSVVLPAEFREKELRRFARNARLPERERESDEFYDVTAWSLPLATGVPALWAAQVPALETEPLSLPEKARKSAAGWAGDVAWPRAGGATGRARSAYVWAAASDGAYRLLARLLGERFRVAVSERALMAGGESFPRGSFIARVGRNPVSLHERLDALAREAGVRVFAAATAFPDRGQTGTGAEATRSVTPPRIAVLAGEGVRITTFGALWFTLERRAGQPFTALRTTDVGGSTLEPFDVVILPSGSYGRTLGEEGTTALREWVERGGTLIAYGSGAGFVLDGDFGTSHVEPDTAHPPADTLAAIRQRIDDAFPGEPELPPLVSPEARPDAPLGLPGTFLRARLDPEHWLTQGYARRELPVLMNALPLRASSEGGNPVVFASGDDLVVSGFAWPDNTGRTYGGQPYATVDRVGEGRVILFADDPLYRATFDAPGRLLLNAIYLSPARGRREAER
ncbi:MAG: M14 family metallopeptidase [Gemmatimonadota bacterium]